MNQILRSWREQKIILKRKFDTLCDEDFLHRDGEEEDMFARLCRKLGKTREEFQQVLADIQKL